MKFSKSAMRAHHLHFAHMTMMQPTSAAVEEPPEAKPRMYSTEKYQITKTNNGIQVPQHVRDRIEATMATPEPQQDPGTTEGDQRSFGGWGFL